MYKDLAGFVTRLTDNINHKQAFMPISEEAEAFLLDHLDEGDYTYMELRDGNAIEVVQVMNYCGGLVFMQRGAEQTTRKRFRCGTGLSFVLTMQGVMDTVCQMDDCP